MSSPFTLRATSPTESATGLVRPDEVRAAAAVLADPAHGIQLQALPLAGWRTCRGDDPESVVNAAMELAPGNRGVYFTLNPCPNGMNAPMRSSAAVCRRWLLVDLDAKRQTNTNSTDAEHEAAQLVAYQIHHDLAETGWPTPLIVDSGNGWHLLYRVDLPNDDDSRDMLRKVLHALAERYDSEAVEVDRRTHDARRISKLPGTLVRKGPADPMRPYRWAQIVLCPEEIEVVTVGQLRTLGGTDTPEAPAAAAPSVFTKRAGVDRKRAYCHRALQCEVANVLLAPPQHGNNALNNAALKLGHLIGAGGIPRQDVEFALLHAATANGRRPEAEARATIKSGLEAGIREPKDLAFLDEPGVRNGTHKARPEPKLPPEGESVIVRACDVPPKKVSWLWPGRLPEGKLTTFAGQTSQGKTFVTCDIIARVSRGLEWPGGEPCESPGQCLFISGDDEADDTIVPRLMAAGADLSRVCFFTEKVQEEWCLAALKTLDRALADMGEDVRLVVVDPPTSYMAGVDDHKNTELRPLLTALKNWAARNRVSVVLITHINKPGANKVEAMARVMGGVAWVTGVRAAFMFVPDPDDGNRQLFLPLKMNLGPKPKGLAYRIVPTESLARVEWLGEVDTTADEAMNKDPKRKRRDLAAAEWLVERFRERREWPSEDLFAAANQDGLSRNAIFEAKGHLRLPRARRQAQPNGDIIYFWWVPEDWPPLTVPATVPPVGIPGHQDDRDEELY